jgi:hypothetical protein
MGEATAVLRLVPPLEDGEDDRQVVAEILSDGTVRARTPALRARIDEASRHWSSGQISNGQWLLWWQRRKA